MQLDARLCYPALWLWLQVAGGSHGPQQFLGKERIPLIPGKQETQEPLGHRLFQDTVHKTPVLVRIQVCQAHLVDLAPGTQLV